jgi:DNA-directed RNA polymerase subunit alpha
MTRIPLPAWAKQSKDQRLEMSTAEIGLPVRTVNCLEDHGVFTVEQLLSCTPEKLLSFPNFGEKTLDEVYRILADIGLCRTGKPTAETSCEVGR